MAWFRCCNGTEGRNPYRHLLWLFWFAANLSGDDFRGPHLDSYACARFAITDRRTTAAARTGGMRQTICPGPLGLSSSPVHRPLWTLDPV
jgi:hypothetical protein